MELSSKGKSRRRLRPKNDFIFQKLFGGKESKESLISLLNAILKLDGSNRIEKITIVDNKELVKALMDDKTGRLDIRAETGDNVQINIEMQLTDRQNMALRTLFYLCKMYTESIKAGEDYNQLKKTITINLLDFKLFDREQYHSTFHLYADDDKAFLLTNVLEVHFLEFPKFERMDKNIHDPLHRWMMYMDERLPEEQLKELMEMDQTIKKTEEFLIKLSSDEEAYRIYEAREHSRYERNSLISEGIARGQKEGKAQGIAEGIAEGRAEGRAEAKLEVAINMLDEGIDSAVIKKVTGYSIEEIKRAKTERH